MPVSKKKRDLSIVTRVGDAGETLLLFGKRVPKDSPHIVACGAFDELNSALGMAKATCNTPRRKVDIEAIQKDLIALMGEISCMPEDHSRYMESNLTRLAPENLERVEEALAELEAGESRFEGWALPGANLHAAALDVARAIARRAECHLAALHRGGFPLRPLLLQYVNRLSDFLWLLAREAEENAQ